MYIYVLMFYMIIFSIIAFMVFLYLLLNKMVIFLEFTLIKLSSLKLEFLLLLDWVSVLFLNVVVMISLMVMFYSIEYMSNDLNLNRFIMMVFLFVLSMLLMIVSPNLISILLGWDGLGLVSYCLVIYYQSKNSFNSGMVTVLSNRLGDILILVTISLMISIGSWNFMFLSKLENLCMYMLIFASFTKSAQFPFSSWLPMAMAAPTPVSSLVHSSTLVTAGVYLIIRLNYLIIDKNLMNLIMLISVMTMFLSGLGANFEFDLKKIIALSTLSQLGVMFFCLSMKLNEMTMFHLLTHAMFKSMLFMCAGVIIHNMINNQDIRKISMILVNMPFISLMFNCSTMSLCGIPFMSGFFSKDLILEMYLMNMFNKFILIMLFISMGLTVSYSVRLIYYSFITLPEIMFFNNYNVSGSYMGVSMYMLFIYSVISGSILSWLLFSSKNVIYLPSKFKMMIYFFMMLGVLFGLLIYKIYLKISYLIYNNNLIKFFSMLWFMPMLYSSWIFKILEFSSELVYLMEWGWIEYFLGYNLLEFLLYLFKLDFLAKKYMFVLFIFITIIYFLMF